MITKTSNYIEITSNCICTYIDEDDGQEYEADCVGCYDDQLYNLNEELAKWQKANNFSVDEIIRVEASGLGWTRQSGHKDILITEIPRCLNIDGDFTIKYSFSDDYETLTAVRYSHDEPVGTGEITFSRSPLTNCDRCGYPALCKPFADESFCDYCYDMESE
jgi:hypothetical protein